MTDRPALVAPRSMLERKPPHGKPCTNCGLCCLAVICDLGEHVIGSKKGPCPALTWGPDGSSCSLTRLTGLGGAAKTLIGTGTGCDARFNGEPTDVGFYLTLAKWDHDHAEEIAAARQAWGMDQ